MLSSQVIAGISTARRLRTRFILFGNPKAGTPVMAVNPHAAVELPLRMVMREDTEGHRRVDSRDVSQTLGPLYGIDAEVLTPPQRVVGRLQAAVQQAASESR